MGLSCPAVARSRRVLCAHLALHAGPSEAAFVVAGETNGGTAAAPRFAADAGLAIE
jgi:hypothetical protein